MDKEKLKKVGKILLYIFLGIVALIVIFIVIQWLTAKPLYESTQGNGLDSLGFSSESGPSDWLNIGESSKSSNSDNPASSETDDEKKVKTGDISVIVDDLDAAKNSLNNILSQYNGEIMYSYESGEGVDRYISETIKVRAEDFEEVFKKISSINGEIEYSRTNASDVTEEYTDLQSRLNNLKAVESQLLKIMESAKTVEDTLAVYTKLSETRSEIEVLEGQIKYLDNQTDYSYITVNFSLSSTGAEIIEKEWKPYGVLKDAFRALVNVLKGIMNVLIWLVVFSPLVLIGVGIYRLIAKKSKSKMI